MHALIENGAVKQYPYSFVQLKAANPDTSFPAQANDEMLAAFGVLRVFFSTPPVYDEAAAVLVEDTPVFSEDDQRWTQVWSVRPLTPEELQQRYDAQAAQVRAERNEKLSASDWTQLPDAPVDHAAWAAYRQDLRDVTAQAEFPWTINWPAQPE
jgi:hypothetical protein